MERIRVLQSEPFPNEFTNPYISQLFASLGTRPDIELVPWSFRNALFTRFDVLHVHWPEVLIRKRTRARSYVATLLFLVFYVRLRLSGAVVVRTVHNTAPHEGLSWLAGRLVQALEQRTIAEIHLNSATLSTSQLDKAVVVPHGHYRDWFSHVAKQDPIVGRLSYTGLLRPYKGIEDLIRAFRAMSDPEATLVIAGQNSDSSYRDLLDELAATDERIHLEFRFLTDEEIVHRITESELFVLPYKYVVNSGAALLSLSLGVPVLVRDSPSMRELAAEVGENWVQTFSDELSATDLAVALARARQIPVGSTPCLDRREWDDAGEAHAQLYAAARSAK